MVRYQDDGKRGIQKDHAQCKFGDNLQLNIAAKGGEAIIRRPLTKSTLKIFINLNS